MKVFLSYSRNDASVAAAVGEDVRQMGNVVWYDREVAGGQSWWNAILGQIRECDLFIFILTPRSLDSQACRSEYAYASALRKRVLPVLCRDGVKINVLPAELSVIQFVDYRSQDKQAAFALVKALQDVPQATPLPDPLPAEPPVPVSYLGDLRSQIEVAQNLTLTEQRDLLYRIKPRLKDPESSDDAQELLRLLRAREDLLASVAEEIDALSTGAPLTKPGKTKSHAYDASLPGTPGVFDLYRDNGALESLIHSVVATSEGWTLQAGEDNVSIYAENGELVLAAVFLRWTEKESKRFMAMGWESNDRIIKSAAAVLGIATYGLGFGLLLHKGTRDFVKKNLLVKRFAPSAQPDVVANVLEAFRILESDTTAIKVSRLIAPPKKFSLWPR
jgi:TIR domain